MKILGIDLSLNSTAITCLDDTNKHVVYFFTKIKSLSTKFERSYYLNKDLIDMTRLNFVSTKIKEILTTEEPDYVAIEDYSYASVGQQFDIGELGGVIKLMIIKEFETPLRLYKPTQIKQFITGKGHSPKSVILTAIYKRYKIDFSEYESSADDVADSYGIAKMLQTELKLRERPITSKAIEKKLFLSKTGYCSAPFITL